MLATAGVASINAAACVSRYNLKSVSYDEKLTRTTIPDRYAELASSWARVNAICDEVQARMEREIDGIEVRNKAIGAGFALIAAGLATGSGLYSLWEGDDADARVTATLGLGAGAATIPSFWYFGSDERQSNVRDRRKTVDEKRKATLTAYEALKQADRELDRAKKANAAEDIVEARRLYQETADKLDDGLIALSDACR